MTGPSRFVVSCFFFLFVAHAHVAASRRGPRPACRARLPCRLAHAMNRPAFPLLFIIDKTYAAGPLCITSITSRPLIACLPIGQADTYQTCRRMFQKSQRRSPKSGVLQPFQLANSTFIFKTGVLKIINKTITKPSSTQPSNSPFPSRLCSPF
jgi:hypothetical protein